MTNILALPLAHVVIAVSNNEDWIDSLVVLVSDSGPPLPRANAILMEEQPILMEDDLRTERNSGLAAGFEQMDLSGIAFEAQVRRRPPDNEVVLLLSGADGSLSVGSPPNFGHLLFYVQRDVMQRLWAGRYVGDVRASDDHFERIFLTLQLDVIEGVVRT
jgi:hypothetical protein